MFFPVSLMNKTVALTFNVVIKYLQGPVLIFHDYSDVSTVDSFSQELTKRYSMMAATPKDILPMQDAEIICNSYVAKSVVLVAQTPKTIYSYFRDWRLWSARYRVLVVVNSPESVQQWLEVLWQKLRVVRVIVMVNSMTPSYYTWFPYRPSECNTVASVVQVPISNLFPRKIPPTLNGCSLKAVISKTNPMVIDEHNGVEITILQVLAEKLNASLHFEIQPSVWVCFDAAGNPIGGMKIIWENEADFMFGNLQRAASLARTAEFTTSHTQDDMRFYVPAPLPASRALSLIRAFRLEAWLYITAEFFIIIVVNLILSHYLKDNSLSALISATAINLNVSFNLPNNRAYKVFVVFAYIYALHITTAYTSCLLAFLSDSPREKAIKSIKDLVTSNLLIQVLAPYKTALNYYEDTRPLLDQPHRMKYVPSLNLTLVKIGKSALEGPKIAYSTALSNGAEYFDEDGLPLILRISPALFTMPLNFYMSMGHPLLPVINTYILWLVEGGITEFFLDNLEGHGRLFIYNRSPLGIENVIGAYFVLGAGLFLSFITFITEVTFKHCSRMLLPMRFPFFLRSERNFNGVERPGNVNRIFHRGNKLKNIMV